jgi:hypothetical protein
MLDMRMLLKVVLITLAIFYGLFAVALWMKTRQMNDVLVTSLGKRFNYLTLINLWAAIGVIILTIVI